MVVVPIVAAAAVTRPLVDTVATAGLLDDQLTGRVSTLLCASSNSTVSCSVPPWNTVALGGLTVTIATGAWVTVSSALPIFPSLVATMFAVPTVTALTTPCAETVATNVLLELHDTARPVSTAPFASSVIAAACAVPTAVMEFGVRVTVTEATGTGITVMEEDPVFPSLVALIVAEPTTWAVTSPFRSTVAIVLSVDDQVTARPVSVLPLTSFVVAVSCCMAPTITLGMAGFTVTVATGTGVTVRVAWPFLVSLVATMCAVPAATDVTNPLDETVATL
jgi:hypothetical protein